jgi:hypothetical protein
MRDQPDLGFWIMACLVLIFLLLTWPIWAVGLVAYSTATRRNHWTLTDS